MTDTVDSVSIDEVINGLKDERECVSCTCDYNCELCRMMEKDKGKLLAIYDYAIRLLEERTSVKPKSKSRRGTSGQVYEHRCGKCNSRLFGKQKFCSYCGREVKWK